MNPRTWTEAEAFLPSPQRPRQTVSVGKRSGYTLTTLLFAQDCGAPPQGETSSEMMRPSVGIEHKVEI